MKIYFAAFLYNDFIEGGHFWSRLDDREKQAVQETQDVLDSFHYINNERMKKRIRKSNKRIFLDSGAFSAFTQGVSIRLDSYCRYIKENEDFILVSSVLDAIGDPDATYHNLKEMERQGIQTLPCFHYGEPMEILDWYASEYDYITLGGMVPVSSAQLRKWLDQIWDRLVDEEGRPKIKVHGFGLTSIPLTLRYPWYSVDSSSWVQMGGIGNIFLPGYGTIAVSELAPQRKEAGKHIDNLTETERTTVVQYIEGLGFNMERMRTSHLTRKCYNLVAYKVMSEMLTKMDKRYMRLQPGIFA